jgi:hypothetical protein
MRDPNTAASRIVDPSPIPEPPGRRPSPRLAADLESERARIRTTLTFEHVPLEGKGGRKTFSLADWNESPFRQIVEELLVAYWEVASPLDTDTVQGDLSRLRQFLRFLADSTSLHACQHTPMTMKEVSFVMLRDFEHWLSERPKESKWKIEERELALREYLATHELPRRHHRRDVVRLEGLNFELGFTPGYIQRHSSLMDIVRAAAAHHGLVVSALRSPPLAQAKERKECERLTTSAIEEIYYTLNKTLRHIELYRRHLLADDFVLPALSDPDRHRRRIKSPALTPVEFEAFRLACLAAIRRVKTRLLIDGPDRAARGHPDPLNEPEHVWGRELDNLIAYLATYAPGQLVVQTHRPNHRRYLNAVYRRPETPHEIALWLSPSFIDLAPFLFSIASSEYAPLNLASLIDLYVDDSDPKRHCVRDDSPTPGHKRIYFGKPRAGIDQAWIDVPARSSLDIPGLIDSVVSITRELRAGTSVESRHRLWLYLSERGGVRALSSSYVTQRMVREFLARENICGDDGTLLRNMYFRRLRPTVIGDVALDNSLETAQKRAAHADPIKTLAYVNNPGNEARVRAIVSSAQSKAVAAVRANFKDRPDPEEVRALALELNVPEGAALEIILGRRDKLFSACVDDMNGRGPEVAGRHCGKFEACLICVNSVIIERHLPRLIAYYLYWLGMAEVMDEAAWRENHELNCAIVEVHLTKFEPDLVARITAEVRARPQAIGYRRFKQS